MSRVVQDNSLGEVPPEDAEILDVVSEDAGAVVLVQAVPTEEIMHVMLNNHCRVPAKLRTPVTSC